jgi:uncharacterized tellurite resistance protein B-like protein
MFESIRKFVTALTEGEHHPGRFEDNDYRLASAALLVHAAGIDGVVSDPESAKLHAVLKRAFALDDAQTDALVVLATQADQQAIDLYHFTSLINRSLDEDGRLRMVAMMWEIAYADGSVSEFEDNLIWRAADLLGIDSQQRIALREQVAGARGTPDDTAASAGKT